MFEHLGVALVLLRSLTGKSQAQVARESGLGKSQLSKYEVGKELPKLDSLARLLQALGVTPLDFACTLALVQQRAARLAAGAPPAGGEELALLAAGPGLLAQPVDEVLRKLLEDLLTLHRHWFEAVLFKERP